MIPTEVRVGLPASAVRGVLDRVTQAGLDGPHHYSADAMFLVTVTVERIQPACPPLAMSAAQIEVSKSHRAVLDAVAAGATRPSEIEEATGLKHRRVAELLKELVAAGHLTQPRYGRYERAA